MLVVEIDDVDAETLEAAVAGATNVGWGAVHAAAGTVGIDAEAELGGDYDTIARDFGEKFSYEFFVLEWTVDFRGVEKIATEFKVTMQDTNRFVVVRGAVGEGHAHAAEAKGGYLWAVLANFA
jgi:hypothetical protein